MHIKALKTDVFVKNENLFNFIIKHAKDEIKEKTVLAVTSKIVSLSEGRLAPVSLNKKSLVQKEADLFLGEIGYGCFLTIKEGLLIASAGIDESNSPEAEYILYPLHPQKTCEILCNRIKKSLNVKNFGLVFTDSKTVPLRRGVVGAGLAYAGFKGVKDMQGQKDLFGRQLQMTSVNNVDALSASATLLMGEGRESRPLAIINNAPVQFCSANRPEELKIPFNDDLYRPLLEKSLQM